MHKVQETPRTQTEDCASRLRAQAAANVSEEQTSPREQTFDLNGCGCKEAGSASRSNTSRGLERRTGDGEVVERHAAQVRVHRAMLEPPLDGIGCRLRVCAEVPVELIVQLVFVRRSQGGKAVKDVPAVVLQDVISADTVTGHWEGDRKSTRLNSSHSGESRMPSSA